MTHTTDYDLKALLGDVETTPEQRDELLRVINLIDDLHGEPGEPDLTSEMINGALMLVLGDANLESLGAEYRAAKDRERQAMDRLWGGIITSVERGVPESVAARRAGVARDTGRKALGK